MKPKRTIAPCEVLTCTHVFHFHDVDLKTAQAMISQHYANDHPYGATSELLIQLAVISPDNVREYVIDYLKNSIWARIRAVFHKEK